jgi:valyl-tRNA synthetase
MGRPALNLTIGAGSKNLALLEPVLSDVLSAARCDAHQLVERADLEDGSFEILDAEFAPQPEKTKS